MYLLNPFDVYRVGVQLWWMLMFLLWSVSLVVSCLHVHSWQPWQPSSLGVAYCLSPQKDIDDPGTGASANHIVSKGLLFGGFKTWCVLAAGERLMDYSLLTADSWRCSPQVAWDQNWGLLVAIKDVKPESTKGLPCGQPYIYQTKLDAILTKRNVVWPEWKESITSRGFLFSVMFRLGDFFRVPPIWGSGCCSKLGSYSASPFSW